MADAKSMISQLQTVGEEVLGKVASTDAARSALQRANDLRDRASKSLTGLEGVEKRLDAIEKRLAALEGTGKAKQASKSESPAKSSGPKAETAS